jgi:hypothetical protein
MNDKQNSVTSFPLFDQKLDRIHAIHLSHALRGALLVPMVLVCACGVASGQIFFPDGKDHVTVDPNAGPDGNGRIYVGDYSIPPPYAVSLPAGFRPSTHVASVEICHIPGLPGPLVLYQNGRAR